MKCEIKKMNLEKRPFTPIRKNKEPLSKRSSLKLSYNGLSPSPSKINSRIKDKQTVQTLMTAKSTYVEQLSLSSTSWCVFDSKKSTCLGFRERYQREVASITKIMTTIVSIEFIEKYQIPKDLLVKVTESSAKLNGTTAELKQKTWIKLWDLLYGAMLPSGNDAANLLSEVIGYFRKNPLRLAQFGPKGNYLDLTKQNTNMFTVEFIKMMNRKAEELELTFTKFSNPHGLQNAMNISTPRDIISLSMHVAANPQFRKIMNTQNYKCEYLQEISSTQNSPNTEKLHYAKKGKKFWWNTNLLLNKGWEGIKTGQTSAAGACLASVRNGIYIVVLNCKNNEARFAETEKLYDWYIENYVKTSTEDSEREESV